MTDLRKDLDNAIDELSEETHGTAVHTDGALPETEEPILAKPSEAEETPESEETQEEGGEEAGGDKPAEPEASDTGGEQVASDSLKAPLGWSPKARETWSKLPPEVQSQITERESHIARTLGEAADDRAAQEALNQLTDGYGALMQQEGITDPMQAIAGLFDSANKMRNGTMEQRAAHVAGMVNYYGIDIAALDDALSGQQSPQNRQNSQLEQMIDERMAPINRFMGQLDGMQQQNRQRQEQEALQEIEAFDGEFKQDLRMQMADFIDMAAGQGRQLSLQEAYDMAVASNPEISQLLAERQHTADLTGQQQSLAGKRAAASSVQSSGAPATGGGDLSLREQLESAWGS